MLYSENYIHILTFVLVRTSFLESFLRTILISESKAESKVSSRRLLMPSGGILVLKPVRLGATCCSISAAFELLLGFKFTWFSINYCSFYQGFFLLYSYLGVSFHTLSVTLLFSHFSLLRIYIFFLFRNNLKIFKFSFFMNVCYCKIISNY